MQGVMKGVMKGVEWQGGGAWPLSKTNPNPHPHPHPNPNPNPNQVAELRDARAEVAQRAHEQQARTQAQARLAESAAYEQVAAAEMKWRDTVGGFQRGSNPCA